MIIKIIKILFIEFLSNSAGWLSQFWLYFIKYILSYKLQIIIFWFFVNFQFFFSVIKIIVFCLMSALIIVIKTLNYFITNIFSNYRTMYCTFVTILVPLFDNLSNHFLVRHLGLRIVSLWFMNWHLLRTVHWFRNERP